MVKSTALFVLALLAVTAAVQYVDTFTEVTSTAQLVYIRASNGKYWTIEAFTSLVKATAETRDQAVMFQLTRNPAPNSNSWRIVDPESKRAVTFGTTGTVPIRMSISSDLKFAKFAPIQEAEAPANTWALYASNQKWLTLAADGSMLPSTKTQQRPEAFYYIESLEKENAPFAQAAVDAQAAAAAAVSRANGQKDLAGGDLNSDVTERAQDAFEAAVSAVKNAATCVISPDPSSCSSRNTLALDTFTSISGILPEVASYQTRFNDFAAAAREFLAAAEEQVKAAYTAYTKTTVGTQARSLAKSAMNAANGVHSSAVLSVNQALAAYQIELTTTTDEVNRIYNEAVNLVKFADLILSQVSEP